MKIDILSLFPEMFNGFLNESIIKRTIDKNLVSINIINFRDYTNDPHNKVDDVSFGGGPGMVLMPQPIFDAIDDLKSENSTVILLTPKGERYNQHRALDFSKEKHLIFICGHYEGFDERIRTLADYEISLGDFILTGGEIPAMAIVDSIVRLLDGAINSESLKNESFNNGLYDYPVYTKPRIFRGLEVPMVLLSGDHKKIDEYRKSHQKEITDNKK